MIDSLSLAERDPHDENESIGRVNEAGRVMLVQVVAFPSAWPQLPFDIFREGGRETDMSSFSFSFFFFFLLLVLFISQYFYSFSLSLSPLVPRTHIFLCVLVSIASSCEADGNWKTWWRPSPTQFFPPSSLFKCI